MNVDEQSQRTATASGCWLMAGAAYLILEAVAAAAYRPDYSYAHNTISDLGPPSRQSAGATIGSGFASAMNAAFYLQGILFLVGAVLLCAPAGGRTPEHSLASSPLTPSATSWSAPLTADRLQMSEDPLGFMPAARSWRSSGATRPFSPALGAFAVARARVGTTPSHLGLVSSAWPAS